MCCYVEDVRSECFFRRLINIVGVGVGEIVSDYCLIPNDGEEFAKIKRFVGY